MIFLGLNSSGVIHFGNYISLIKPVLKYNLKKIFLADLHSFSKKISINYIIKNKILTIFIFLSFFKNTFFYQSFNNNFLKIFWLILCFFNKNKIKYFHFFKKNLKISLGKVCYPLLMCSDIITNNNKFIFVGLDQIQHIEIYKKIKKKINNFLNISLFNICKFIINNKILYSYDKKKMSKSNKNDLFLFSEKKEIFFFLKKFKNTKKKKKSILNFSLNIINNNYIIDYFYKNNKNNFLKKISNLIFYKFLIFKKKFFIKIREMNFFLKKSKIFNLLNNNILNKNKKNIDKIFNL